MAGIMALDIGGANIKAARFSLREAPSVGLRVVSHPFEIWRERDRLPDILREIASRLFSASPPESLAVTMTAELSDIFATKREGVTFILNTVRGCFPGQVIYVLDLSGGFFPVREALLRPPDFAATNWLASAQWISRRFPNCLFIDVGGTTTDILPVLDGRVSVAGHTDMARLTAGELVFTGALRTNLAAIVHSVPVSGRSCRVASEYFSISGDVHLILGNLRPQDYTCTTPDGQPPSLESARRRLARLVCADTEMLSDGELEAMAQYIGARQVDQICDGLRQVLLRLPELRRHPVVVAGSGMFLGVAAAKRMDLHIADPGAALTETELAVIPCVAAARLLAEWLGKS